MATNESSLQQSIFRDKAAKAMQMDPGLKLTSGARLFDVARHRMIAGIRSGHPDWSDAEIDAEFCRQLQILDPHHQERFARRRRQHVPDCRCEAWVATADDVVIQKLGWARRKDLDDVVNLLAVSGSTLDWAYIRRWTDSHGTSGLLDRLRGEAGVE